MLKDASIRSSHARRSSHVRLDRALHAESPESGEPRVPHDRDSAHRAVHPAVRDRAVRARLLAGAAGPVRGRVGVSVHRPRVRGQAAGVLEGLALPVRGPAVVVGEAPRTGLGGSDGQGPYSSLRIRFTTSFSSPAVTGSRQWGPPPWSGVPNTVMRASSPRCDPVTAGE